MPPQARSCPGVQGEMSCGVALSKSCSLPLPQFPYQEKNGSPPGSSSCSSWGVSYQTSHILNQESKVHKHRKSPSPTVLPRDSEYITGQMGPGCCHYSRDRVESSTSVSSSPASSMGQQQVSHRSLLCTPPRTSCFYSKSTKRKLAKGQFTICKRARPLQRA